MKKRMTAIQKETRRLEKKFGRGLYVILPTNSLEGHLYSSGMTSGNYAVSVLELENALDCLKAALHTELLKQKTKRLKDD